MQLAIDILPLVEPFPSGIGSFTDNLIAHFDESINLKPFAFTFRNRAQAKAAIEHLGGVTKPLLSLVPAGALHRSWRALQNYPAIESWTGPVDVVHGTNFVAPPSTGAARLISIHDLFDLKSNPTKRIYRLLGQSVAAGAHFHASSRATMKDCKDVLGIDDSHLHFIPLGLPEVLPGTIEAQKWASEMGKYILAVGDFVPRKNYLRLVEAFNEIAGHHRDVRLLLVGGHKNKIYSAQVLQAVEASPFCDRIEANLQWIDASRKGALMRNAVCVAYPSFDEGFGLPLLEAQSVAVPVVATGCASLLEVGDGHYIAVSADSSAAIAEGLDLCLRGDYSANLVALAKSNAGKYSWRTCSEQFALLYEELMEK